MKTAFNLFDWVRPSIAKLKPYSSARDEFSESSEAHIFLDANENPYLTHFNRYPDPQQGALKALISKIKGVKTKNILIGNGSDEVLDLIIRVFCEPRQDEVMILPPTYGMYQVLANVNHVKIIEIPLTASFQPNTEAVLENVSTQTKILFLCSPNNPSGNLLDSGAIETILHGFQGIVVIDEAYIDFAKQESFVSMLDQYPNLIVIQTLSKAYGLAGIRIGLGFASEEIIGLLNRIKPPYNVNVLSQNTAIQTLSNLDKTKKQVIEILHERERLKEALEAISFVQKTFDSDANFLLVRVDDANKRYQQLLSKNIVVRNRHGQLNCDQCLRFTIGTPNENNSLIQALNSL